MSQKHLTKEEKRRLSNYYLDKSFQSRFIAKILAVVILACIAVGVSVYLATHVDLSNSQEMTDMAMRLSEGETTRMPKLVVSILIIGITSIIVIATLFLFFTHRVVGPVYRFKRCMQAIADKDLTERISLRRFDEFNDFAAVYNDTLNKLTADFKGMQKQLRKLEKTAQTVRPLKTRDELQTSITALKHHIQNYKTGR